MTFDDEYLKKLYAKSIKADLDEIVDEVNKALDKLFCVEEEHNEPYHFSYAQQSEKWPENCEMTSFQSEEKIDD